MIMEKILTIFKRDDRMKITQEYAIDPEFFSQAIPTEKVDGTNVRLTVRNHTLVRLEKRRNPSKIEKAKGIIEPWYVDADEYSPEDKYIWEAARNTDLTEIEDGEWSSEAIGPKIQGNPLQIDKHILIIFSHVRSRRKLYTDVNTPTTYDELKIWLPQQKSRINPNVGIEGVVWWRIDGQRGKIKTKDFS